MFSAASASACHPQIPDSAPFRATCKRRKEATGNSSEDAIQSLDQRIFLPCRFSKVPCHLSWRRGFKETAGPIRVRPGWCPAGRRTRRAGAGRRSRRRRRSIPRPASSPAGPRLPGLDQPVGGERLHDLEERARLGEQEGVGATEEGEQRHDRAHRHGHGVGAEDVPEQMPSTAKGTRPTTRRPMTVSHSPAESRTPNAVPARHSTTMMSTPAGSRRPPWPRNSCES